MIVIKIHGWHPERAWTSFHRKEVQQRIVAATGMTLHEAKCVAVQIRDKQLTDLAVTATTRVKADSFRRLLDALGAETTVEEISNPTI